MDTTKLPPNVLRTVREFVRENRLYSRPADPDADFDLASNVDRHIESLDPKEVLDYWLKWEGVIGYTDDIWELTKLLHAQ